MNNKIENEYLTCTLDPLGQWPEYTAQDHMDACGYLPQWLVQYAAITDDSQPPLKDHMEDCYGFGALHQMTGGHIKKNLVYTYPEDPPMYPIMHMKLKNSGAEFVQWPHAIVAMRQDKEDEWFVTRMD